MTIFNKGNGDTTQVPSATAEFGFMENDDPKFYNCTPPQLAERLGLTLGDGEFSVADIITKGPWVDIRAFLPVGYVLDGSVDYTTEIQEAIDSGAGVIFTGNDRAIFRVSRIVGRSNLEFTGNGTFDFSNNASYATSVLDPLILFEGSCATGMLLTADALPGALTADVADTSSFAVGNLVEIYTPTHNGGFVDTINVFNGELFEVSGVTSGTRLTFRSQVLDLNGYTTANGAMIRKVNAIENVTIGKDITIIGKGRPQPSGTGDYGIVFFYGRNINVHCNLKYVDSRGVYFQSCYKYTASGMDILHNPKGTSSETNYGICPAGSSKFGNISYNTLTNMRHGVVTSHLSTALGTFYGVSRVTDIHHNTITNNWHAGIATHNDTELIFIHDNVIESCTFGINPRDRRASVINNTLINNDQHIYSQSRPNSILVQGNKAYGGGYLLSFPRTETGYDVDDVTIIDNHGFGSRGISFNVGPALTVHKRLSIKNNTLHNIPGEGGNTAGIRVYGGSVTGMQVCDNSIFGNANGAGIRIEGITDGEIMRNTVRNVSGHGYNFTTPTNCYAKGNTAKGCGTYAVGMTNLKNATTFIADNTNLDVDAYVPANFVNLTDGTANLNISDIITKGPVVDVRAHLPDGAVTDASVAYQSGVAAAVAAAYAAGLELYWPHVYLTTASIPNFHDVRHKGPGGVKRGSTIFYIDPKLAQTNTLFVATTGADTNDGITASQPLLTVQKSFDILAEFAPCLPGRWVISIADGTYTETLVMDSASRSEYPVYIKASTALGHPNVPNVVIQPAVSSDTILTFSEGGGWFVLTDIRLTGATTGTALVLNSNVRVSPINVHIDGCLKGVTNQHGTMCAPAGGIWTGLGRAVSGGIGFTSQYAARHAFTGTGAGNGVQIKNFERGLLINEGAQGHVDGVQISGCGTGINNKRGAGAVNTTAVYIELCDIGVLNENNAWFNNAITFGSGANANTVNVRSLGDSPELVQRTTTTASRTLRLVESKYGITHTGTTAQTVLWTLPTIPAWAISEAGDVARFVIIGQPTLTTGTATLKIVLDNGTRDELAAVTIPNGITDFSAVVEIAFPGSNAQRCSITLITNAGQVLGYGTGVLQLKNTASFLTLESNLSDAGDTLAIRFAEYFSTIGG